jgi:hypothetical protein
VQAELNKKLFKVGAEARVNIGLDGSYNVVIGAQGTF